MIFIETPTFEAGREDHCSDESFAELPAQLKALAKVYAG